ncbi:MAG: hypothetical protein Q9169_007173 [Polycauliona sp. 2 TL-2023]
MSEVRSRPSAVRGRGSGRGPRGGYSSRGGRPSTRQMNGDMADSVPSSTLEEEGELGELKRMYSSKLSTIKELFPNYTDEDIVFALQETDGNLEATIDRISEGNISQWGEVKKKTKDRSQPRSKDPAITTADAAHTSTRGGRGRGGIDGFRGRGRGSERPRGTTRGGRVASAAAEPRSTILDKSSTDAAPAGAVGDWDKDTTPDGVTGGAGQTTETDNAGLDSSWENINSSEVAPTMATEPAKPSLKPDGSRTWASMFNRPAAPEIPKRSSKEAPLEEATSDRTSMPASNAGESDMPGLPPPLPAENINPDVPNTPPSPSMVSSEQAADLTPTKDELTETNLEQVLDASGPANTATAASTVASTIDHRMGSGTPMQPSTQASTSRPPLGGFATSAQKATGMPGRSSSFQRRVLEQQEAVVMPGKHAVDRAAVQFGSMGLNGSSEDLDVDDDREEPETRGQPPQHSPIAPKATLPPPVQGTQSLVSEPLTTPRQAPGLPPLNQQSSQQSMQPLDSDRNVPQQPSQSSYPYNQFSGGFGPQPTPREQSAPTQKPYEPFGTQIQQPHQPFDVYSSTSQGPPPSQHGGLSSAPHDMSSYYTSDSQRNAYQSYYNSYAHQQNPQDAGHMQHRTPSAFGTSAAEQTVQHSTGQQPSSRYGQVADPQGSGSSTPNPSLPGQGQPAQPTHMLQQQPQQPQQGQSGGQQQHGGYPYGHPFYPSPYYQAYLNQNGQFGYGNSQAAGFGAPKQQGAAGMYGQHPQPGYGISPQQQQASYDHHAASPAAHHGAFGHQASGAGIRDGASGAGGHMSSYGNRTGSTQPPSEHQQQQYPGAGGVSSAAAGYGMADAFGRSGSAFSSGPNHGLSGHQQQQQQAGSQQPSSTTADDSLRGAYGGDSGKMATGPSPAPGMLRPGSAVNNMPGLAPSHSQNQQYGGYPSHLSHQMHAGQQQQQQASQQYGGGHHQSAGGQHQSGAGYGGGPYGAGGMGGGGGGFAAAGGGGSNYYGGQQRGGWGSNYGH